MAMRVFHEGASSWRRVPTLLRQRSAAAHRYRDGHIVDRAASVISSTNWMLSTRMTRCCLSSPITVKRHEAHAVIRSA